MATLRKILEGNTDEFALEISFQSDPDAGEAATPEESASWGGFKLWVRGQNLCAHIEFEETRSSVQWYLLPLLRWFISNWDFIFHEQKLPVGNPVEDAWSSLKKTMHPPAALEQEPAADDWSRKWHRWWECHSIMSGRNGGPFPDIVIRRWEDLLEISWGSTRAVGLPDGFQFLATPRFARVSLTRAAETVFRVLEQALCFLKERCPQSITIGKLENSVTLIKSADSTRRLALLAGLSADVETAIARWSTVVQKLRTSPATAAVSEALDAEVQAYVVSGSPHAALMFGSASPNLTDNDAVQLAERIIRHFVAEGSSSELDNYVDASPIVDPAMHPWEQGYSLAEEFLESLELPASTDQQIDIGQIYDRLGIIRETIALDDHGTRAVAIAGPRHCPTVVLNESHPTYQWAAGQRFTLAHELCHLLHDQEVGRPLALVSGPWAPLDVEKRANAFAAMLLMPPELIRRAVQDLSDLPLGSHRSIAELAGRFQTSITATREHLANLGFLSAAELERAEVEYDQGQAIAGQS